MLAIHFMRKALSTRSLSERGPRQQFSLGKKTFGLTAAMATVCATVLVGCSKPVEKIEDIRPVRVMKLQVGEVNAAHEFSGEVRPRIESRLGFRVNGKIASRDVEVGMLVKRGQVLLRLDPRDLQLVQAQGQAALRSAQSNRDLALAERKRYQELRDKNFVSQAVLDGKVTAYLAAQAGFEQAQAGLQAQSNQASYAVLTSDTDGVVTGIDAEVGQVVAAGSPLVRVAQLAEKEVTIGIPENKVGLLAKSKNVHIRLWANQELLIEGKIREIAPVADAATRTYAAKVTLLNPPAEVKLGMTAFVSFVNEIGTNMIKVPLNALYQEKGATSLWVVENEAVKLLPVVVAGPSGNDMLIAKGVTAGQLVVTAGVNLLKPGQKVKILPDAVVNAPPKGDSLVAGKTAAATTSAASVANGSTASSAISSATAPTNTSASAPKLDAKEAGQ